MFVPLWLTYSLSTVTIGSSMHTRMSEISWGLFSICSIHTLRFCLFFHPLMNTWAYPHFNYVNNAVRNMSVETSHLNSLLYSTVYPKQNRWITDISIFILKNCHTIFLSCTFYNSPQQTRGFWFSTSSPNTYFLFCFGSVSHCYEMISHCSMICIFLIIRDLGFFSSFLTICISSLEMLFKSFAWFLIGLSVFSGVLCLENFILFWD